MTVKETGGFISFFLTPGNGRSGGCAELYDSAGCPGSGFHGAAGTSNRPGRILRRAQIFKVCATFFDKTHQAGLCCAQLQPQLSQENLHPCRLLFFSPGVGCSGGSTFSSSSGDWKKTQVASDFKLHFFDASMFVSLPLIRSLATG
ncbi:MAG: hypothetical protein U0Z53_13840 [Blastocatellia bacterium]